MFDRSLAAGGWRLASIQKHMCSSQLPSWEPAVDTGRENPHSTHRKNAIFQWYGSAFCLSMKNTIQLPKKGKTLHSQPDSTFNVRCQRLTVSVGSKTGTPLALRV